MLLRDVVQRYSTKNLSALRRLLARDRRGLTLPSYATGVRHLDIRDLLTDPRATLGTG